MACGLDEFNKYTWQEDKDVLFKRERKSTFGFSKWEVGRTETDKYEGARQTIQKHFNAKHSHEIIFTSAITYLVP